MSAPVTTKTGAPFSRYSTLFKLHDGKSQGIRTERGSRGKHTDSHVSPSLGGRTVADQFPGFLTFSENSQISQRWENSSIPRMASGLENSGSKTIFASRSPVRPLCLGIPNFVGKSVWIYATGRILWSAFRFSFFLLPYLSPPYQCSFHSVLCP